MQVYHILSEPILAHFVHCSGVVEAWACQLGGCGTWEFTIKGYSIAEDSKGNHDSGKSGDI